MGDQRIGALRYQFRSRHPSGGGPVATGLSALDHERSRCKPEPSGQPTGTARWRAPRRFVVIAGAPGSGKTALVPILPACWSARLSWTWTGYSPRSAGSRASDLAVHEPCTGRLLHPGMVRAAEMHDLRSPRREMRGYHTCGVGVVQPRIRQLSGGVHSA